MSSFSLADLAALPTPEIIETLDYEAILAARKQQLVNRASAFGFNYDTNGLETEPGIILLQEAAFHEIVLRARGNEIARRPYLYYARGSEVDHLGAFYDTTRLPGEDDDRYKRRIILGIQGRSTGGTAPRYAAVAMGSSLRVADAFVYTVPPSPVVSIAIFATDNNGVADAGLLATVRAAISNPTVRMVNDTINVVSAVVQTVAVTADVWLLPSADESLVALLQANVPQQWAAEGGLGRDLTRSWLISRLMVSGVQRVAITSPVADVVVQPFTAVRISSLALTVRGRDF